MWTQLPARSFFVLPELYVLRGPACLPRHRCDHKININITSTKKIRPNRMPKDCAESKHALWSCVLESKCGEDMYAAQRDPASAVSKLEFTQRLQACMQDSDGGGSTDCHPVSSVHRIPTAYSSSHLYFIFVAFVSSFLLFALLSS